MSYFVVADTRNPLRQPIFKKVKRVVVKVGSAVLTNDKGLDESVINNLAREVAYLRENGHEVILVSSGSVAAGRRRLQVDSGQAKLLKVKQALAATGQGLLMRSYDLAFSQQGYQVAQLLLTHADLAQRARYLNVRNTIQTLLSFGVIPVVNENDTVSVEELRFGDNDSLGALMANMIDADLYLMLTDVEGLCTANPVTDARAKLISTVTEIDSAVIALAGHTSSALGTGGMQSKIKAAKMVAACGVCAMIAPGRPPHIVRDLFAGQPLGTLFLPGTPQFKGRKHWIAQVLRPQGYLVLDAGACRAVIKGGRSLLPSGICDVRGVFGVGDAVHCLNKQGELIAAGLSNYNAEAVGKIKGRNSTEIGGLLGFHDADEIIHRDNLVLMGTDLEPVEPDLVTD